MYNLFIKKKKTPVGTSPVMGWIRICLQCRGQRFNICTRKNPHSTQQLSLGTAAPTFLGHFCCSVAKLCSTVCGPMDCSRPGFPAFSISQSLLRFMSIELVMLSDNLILCCPLLLLPSIFSSISW